MLYLGNFNYNDKNDDAENYCLMPAVVEAADADEALDRFQAMFERIHAGSDLLDGAKKIYLDSLVELDHLPESAVLVQWQKIVPAGDGLCSITAALPEVEGAGIAAYSWADENEDVVELDEGDDYDDDASTYGELDETELDFDEDGYEEEPFLLF